MCYRKGDFIEIKRGFDLYEKEIFYDFCFYVFYAEYELCKS